MRALVIDDRARAAVKRVLDYASKPENLYVVEAGGRSKQCPPGDNWHHIARLSTYRCVFSFTLEVATKRVFRHLSISVPSDQKYPNVFAAFTIAELFGFVGWDGMSFDSMPADWVREVSKKEHCVVLAQLVRPATTGVS